MSKTRILRMALDEIVGGVKKVDLGDLTKKVNVGDRVEAVKRMLGDAGERVAEKADDWGWKGGKPGEITGTEFVNKLEYSPVFARTRPTGQVTNDEVDILRKGIAQLEDAASRSKPLGLQFLREVDDLRKSGHSWQGAKNLAALAINRDLKLLEEADIPRSLTGATAAAMRSKHNNMNIWNKMDTLFPRNVVRTKSASWMGGHSHRGKPVFVSDIPALIGKELSSLTKSQRETFLSLLPEWSGTLDELADAARTL